MQALFSRPTSGVNFTVSSLLISFSVFFFKSLFLPLPVSKSTSLRCTSEKDQPKLIIPTSQGWGIGLQNSVFTTLRLPLALDNLAEYTSVHEVAGGRALLEVARVRNSNKCENRSWPTSCNGHARPVASLSPQTPVVWIYDLQYAVLQRCDRVAYVWQADRQDTHATTA